MTETISLLGSTGSIGRQTLDVCREQGIRVAALAAGRSVDHFLIFLTFPPSSHHPIYPIISTHKHTMNQNHYESYEILLHEFLNTP